MTTHHYMICPITAIEDFPTLEEAKIQAELLTQKHGREAGGFAIFEVKEIGRFEHQSPIWIETQWPSDLKNRLPPYESSVNPSIPPWTPPAPTTAYPTTPNATPATSAGNSYSNMDGISNKSPSFSDVTKPVSGTNSSAGMEEEIPF